jgi:general stress protein YciG
VEFGSGSDSFKKQCCRTSPENESKVLSKNPSRLGYTISAMNNAVKKYLAEIGRHGGSSTSKEKAEAARQNGKKGGRPRMKGAK